MTMDRNEKIELAVQIVEQLLMADDFATRLRVLEIVDDLLVFMNNLPADMKEQTT